MKTSRSVAVALALLAATIAPTTPAGAIDRRSARQEPVPVLTGPAAKFWGYATPVIVIAKGEALTYTNLDVEKHDVVQDVEADGFGGPKKMPWCKKAKSAGHEHHSHGCPVFWSDLIGLGASTEVLGLENVKAGTTYSFMCTLHHGMKGKLIVR